MEFVQGEDTCVSYIQAFLAVLNRSQLHVSVAGDSNKPFQRVGSCSASVWHDTQSVPSLCTVHGKTRELL